MKNGRIQIEDLPDELFLYIFSFIRPSDLLGGWYNLNSHINSVLRSVPISIKIVTNDDFNDSLSFVEHFYSQIYYLKDERLFPNIEIDVRRLINIRSLYLNQCSNDQFKDIHRDNHPHLTRFFSSSVPWSFYEQILFGQKRFPYLTSVGYLRGGSILLLLNVKYPINVTIRHLHFHSASNETLAKFLQYFGNIISLTIDYFYGNNSSSSTSFNKCYIRRLTIRNTLSSQSHLAELLKSIGYSNLTHLRVSFDTCDFEQLAQLVRNLSFIKQFDVKVKTYPSDLDLISIRLMSCYFSSLNFEYIIDKHNQKRILSIKTINE
jgi:hypothetical protein